MPKVLGGNFDAGGGGAGEFGDLDVDLTGEGEGGVAERAVVEDAVDAVVTFIGVVAEIGFGDERGHRGGDAALGDAHGVLVRARCGGGPRVVGDGGYQTGSECAEAQAENRAE